MTSPQISNPNSGKPKTAGGADSALVLPSFLHAGVYLLFGLITVFYQQPHLTALTNLVALFMLFLGGTTAWSGIRVKVSEPKIGQGLNSIGIILAAAAALLLITPNSDLWTSVIIAVALGFASIMKILVGMQAKQTVALAKDWQLEGLMMTIAAATSTLMSEIGTKAILGTLGGGAIITGVFLLIGVLSAKSDTKKA